MGSFTKLTYHVVFSTKYRRKKITDKIQERLYEYMGGITRNLKGRLIQIGGIEDHVHLLLHLPANKAVSDSIREIKANSSKWLNEAYEFRYRFEWQKGYGAFTVSHSQIESVRNYINNQREHHRTKTFGEELIELLRRHEIQFDRKYLFEAEYVG